MVGCSTLGRSDVCCAGNQRGYGATSASCQCADQPDVHLPVRMDLCIKWQVNGGTGGVLLCFAVPAAPDGQQAEILSAGILSLRSILLRCVIMSSHSQERTMSIPSTSGSNALTKTDCLWVIAGYLPSFWIKLRVLSAPAINSTALHGWPVGTHQRFVQIQM